MYNTQAYTYLCSYACVCAYMFAVSRCTVTQTAGFPFTRTECAVLAGHFKFKSQLDNFNNSKPQKLALISYSKFLTWATPDTADIDSLAPTVHTSSSSGAYNNVYRAGDTNSSSSSGNSGHAVLFKLQRGMQRSDIDITTVMRTLRQVYTLQCAITLLQSYIL
jgi:hypothetical protein